MVAKRGLGLVALLALFGPAVADAGVVVISNGTSAEIRFNVSTAAGKVQEHVLKAGDVLAAPAEGRLEIGYMAADAPRRVELNGHSVYQFRSGANGLELREAFVAGREASGSARAAGGAGRRPPKDVHAAEHVIGTIPVKILVDDDEPGKQRIWEERIRKRLKAASDIVERDLRVRFEVVATGTWDSDDTLIDFQDVMREFETEVNPQPARLAIGFTSQLRSTEGCSKLGGTRGPLHTHVLVREWFGRTEPERLEVLLHELGHYLGAAHSPEADSVMRPVLGDGKAVSRKFRIGLDPLNTLAAYLVAEELRARDVKRFGELTPPTLDRLGDVYTELARVMPSDPVAARYVSVLRPAAPDGANAGGAGRAAPNAAQPPAGSLAAATRQVLAAIVAAAERNRSLPAAKAGQAGRLTGDALADLYFRQAAAAASRVPQEHAVSAYLVALGIAVDSSDLLRRKQLTGEQWQSVESDAERQRRVQVIGTPTMRGRHDTAQHFVVSAALVALVGSQAAEAIGMLKELNDANGGSGFSFADLAADKAGVTFAEQLRGSENLLAELPTRFTVADFVPDLAGLPEGLMREQLAKQFGSTSDERFRAQRAEIRRRIQALPAYRAAPAEKPGER
jgi:hypothetical protein